MAIPMSRARGPAATNGLPILMKTPAPMAPEMAMSWMCLTFSPLQFDQHVVPILSLRRADSPLYRMSIAVSLACQDDLRLADVCTVDLIFRAAEVVDFR
jgi:hypothetical protein